MLDPLAGSPWSAPGTVAGFAQSAPNEVLIRFAQGELRRVRRGRLLDVGCGAGRNSIPLAHQGWTVLGTDLSLPMLQAAAHRVEHEGLRDRAAVTLAPMDQIPAPPDTFDLVVAHGIWNLARSAAEFRRAAAEAARVARAGAGLFVFTFSRNTLPADAEPVPREPFVFTQFSGQPQCFLTQEQLADEMEAAGFARDPMVPVTEYNRPAPGVPHRAGPVIYEASFRRRG